VSLVAVVRSQSERSAGVVYTLDDSSGDIDAVSYANDAGTEVDSEDAMQQEDLSGRYVKVCNDKDELMTARTERQLPGDSAQLVVLWPLSTL
jgi:hypothetical protein